jgi:hypothetical protein
MWDSARNNGVVEEHPVLQLGVLEGQLPLRAAEERHHPAGRRLDLRPGGAGEFNLKRLRNACHKKYAEWLKAQTLVCLHAYWPLVQSLAMALLERGELSGKDVEELLDPD